MRPRGAHEGFKAQFTVESAVNAVGGTRVFFDGIGVAIPVERVEAKRRRNS
jgi:hypothetical protein